jgi:hypothetical protein
MIDHDSQGVPNDYDFNQAMSGETWVELPYALPTSKD